VEPLKKISLTENQMLQKILLAAKQANAFNFIEGFPEKFETIVGERGLNSLEVKDSVSQLPKSKYIDS
jgi:ABC-type transport system involved in Fe-S cluster assembly fused permease/ATPase subunit